MTALPRSEYVSLTTFRRTGAPVATPVWGAPDGDTLVVGNAIARLVHRLLRREGDRHEIIRIRPA